MESKKERAVRYRAEAERLRRNAETMRDSEARQYLLVTAIMYDQMARMIERILD